MHTITVAGLKGGVGKTTTAVGLALHAHHAGLDTLLIDADPQRSAWTWLTEHDDDGIAVEVLTTRRPKAEIGSLSRGRDLVIIDTPPGESDTTRTLAALAAADLVVLPVAPTGLDADRLAHTVDAASAVCDTLAALIVRTDECWKLHRSLVDALQQDPDIALMETVIPDRVEIAGAALDRPSKSLAAYSEAWEEVARALTGLKGK